jgi:uncharacterized protein YrzB (UPF0473 family)
MTDKEKHACDCGEHHDHDCDCGDEDCNCESNVITLDMEDGTQKEFNILNLIEHDGKHYVALSELDSVEYDILRFEEVGDQVELSIIEDDDEYNAVADKFDEIFSEDLDNLEISPEDK